MNIDSSSGQILKPSIDDYEAVKDAFLELAQEPDSRCQADDAGLVLKVCLERFFCDLDFLAWPPLKICLYGVIKSLSNGSRLDIIYTETAYGVLTNETSLVHKYKLACFGNALVEYQQTARVQPEIAEPRQELNTDEQMDRADAGRLIIKNELSSINNLTSGDFGVLFDRMAALII